MRYCVLSYDDEKKCRSEMGFLSRVCRVVFPPIRPNGLTLLNSEITLRNKDEPTDVV